MKTQASHTTKSAATSSLRLVPEMGLVDPADPVQHLSRYGLAGEADAPEFSAGRAPNAANWHKRAWLPARRAAGHPTLRFHDLRHSAVPCGSP
jgi:integrase